LNPGAVGAGPHTQPTAALVQVNARSCNNQAIDQVLAGFAGMGVDGLDFLRYDSFSFLQQVVADPFSLGFTNASELIALKPRGCASIPLRVLPSLRGAPYAFDFWLRVPTDLASDSSAPTGCDIGSVIFSCAIHLSCRVD